MKLDDVGRLLGARAAGTWRVDQAELVLTDFWAAPDLDLHVAEAFRNATRRVSLSRSDLGIVGAVLGGRTHVSIARELPPDAGSGLWLRRFGADRSIAVPHILDGVVVSVASVAVRDAQEDEAIRVLKVFSAIKTESGRSGRADLIGKE